MLAALRGLIFCRIASTCELVMDIMTKFCSFERASRICGNVDLNLPAIAEKFAFLFCVCIFFKIYNRLPDVNNVDIRGGGGGGRLISRLFFPKPVSVLIHLPYCS